MIVQQKKLASSAGQFDKKLEDKLYEDAFDRLQKKEELKIRHDNTQLQKLTFTPELFSKSQTLLRPLIGLEDRPLHERYKEMQNLKEEMLQRLREKFADEEKLTFKPQISKISDKVASLKN